MFMWAKVVVDGNSSGVFAFLGSLDLLPLLVVRLGTTAALICGVLHSTGERRGMCKRNRETLMKPHVVNPGILKSWVEILWWSCGPDWEEGKSAREVWSHTGLERGDGRAGS